jgi:glycosyltransferase involved in cell wall biosynthesis
MISVVVPTYNEEKNIERCLNSLLNQNVTREEYEIIVVDGESKDLTREKAEKLADKVIIQSSEGVGGARNDGVYISQGEIVATTDADCEPYPDWLQVILKNFLNGDVVAVTGILDPYDWGDMSTLEVLAYKSLFWVSNVILVIFRLFGHYHLVGANSAFRKDAFIESGGYMPLAYADDVELFKRIKSRGKVVLDPNMKIHYSVRRIRKLGLIRYIYLLFVMEWNVSILNRKPMKGEYARQTYE